MDRVLEQRLRRLSAQAGLLAGGKKGIEKECLRVAADGTIAQTPHPPALGSALTHPYITTDYSEALLELITPPEPDAQGLLDFLVDTHRFVYARIGEELLWTTSMPCVVSGDESVPIARYGTSHSGMMRHVYRRGLGYRYGRVMQVIAGVHFNYSLPAAFWPAFREIEGEIGGALARGGPALRPFTDTAYFALTRNVLRHGWLLVYLFGASPAVCTSFLGPEGAERFSRFDDHTRYEPHATSLRMSDIGYTNRSPEGLNVVYDDLERYVGSLTWAIETPYPPYEAIGVKVGGEYRQLNPNLLQIENEFYSPVRPKQVAQRGEKPTLALQRRGVEYVEIRLLDVDPFAPAGVSAEQLAFLEVFALACLLAPSPVVGAEEQAEITENLVRVAHRGREPGLELRCGGRGVQVRRWADELLEGMAAVAEVLEPAPGPARAAVGAMRERVRTPDATPSARMLGEMRAAGQGFFPYAMALSVRHRDEALGAPLPPARAREFEAWAEQSLDEQRALESGDLETFEQYIERYFNPPE